MRTGGATTRHPDDQRDAERSIKIVHLAPAMMIAKHLAMIRGHDNDSVLILTGCLEMGDDSPKMMVHLGCQRQIQRAHHRRVFRRRCQFGKAFDHMADPLEIHRRSVEGMGGTTGSGIASNDSRHHRGRVIHAVIRCRRHEGRMRSDIGHMRAPAVGARWQIGQKAVSQERGIAVFGAVQRRGSRPIPSRDIDGVTFGHITVRHVIAKLIQIPAPAPPVVKAHFQRLEKAVHHLLIGGQDRIIRRMMAGIGAGICIPIEKRLDAATAQLFRQVRLVQRQRCSVAHGPVVHRVLAGQQRGARRPTGAGDCHVIGEGHRVIHESPQIRQINRFGKRAIENIGAKLVEHDKQDIWLCG